MNGFLSWVSSVIAICCVVAMMEQLLPKSSRTLKSILSVLLLLAVLSPIGLLELKGEGITLPLKEELLVENEERLLESIIKSTERQIAGELKGALLEEYGSLFGEIDVKARVDSMNNLSLARIAIKGETLPGAEVRSEIEGAIYDLIGTEDITILWEDGV